MASGSFTQPPTGGALEIDITTFFLSLGSSALIHLGDASMPDGTKAVDLEMAHQSIDLLALMKEKTKGNLSPEEARFLESLIADLRLRYVQKTQSSPAAHP